MEYAGAFNALWLLRDNAIMEIKADKQPVGLFLGEELKSFTNNEIAIQKGDAVYVFTDGFADQFGGPKGKKFKYKQLQNILLENSSKSMPEQKTILESSISAWQGNLEQIDDILIIGIRL